MYIDEDCERQARFSIITCLLSIRWIDESTTKLQQLANLLLFKKNYPTLPQIFSWRFTVQSITSH